MKIKLARSLLKKRENCAISKALLSAKNTPEFRKRLTWLSDGCLLYHLSRFKGNHCCEKEKALFNELTENNNK